MNDMFVPGSHREQITWLGLIGIAMQNSQYETSNATYLRFEIEDTGNVYIYIFPHRGRASYMTVYLASWIDPQTASAK